MLKPDLKIEIARTKQMREAQAQIAFSYFLGGAEAMLRSKRAISKNDFASLLRRANEVGTTIR